MPLSDCLILADNWVTTVIAFDVGKPLPNMDLSRDFMGLVVDGSMDLGTHIWNPP